MVDPSDSADLKYTAAGSNFGFFLDLFYKNAEFPLYGHLRFMGGDYEMTTIGIGAKF